MSKNVLSDYQKKAQFNKHIKRINMFAYISSFIIAIISIAVRFTASPEQTSEYMFNYAYTVIFLLLLVHLKANNLKQKAIIRYMTDSIGDLDH